MLDPTSGLEAAIRAAEYTRGEFAFRWNQSAPYRAIGMAVIGYRHSHTVTVRLTSLNILANMKRLAFFS